MRRGSSRGSTAHSGFWRGRRSGVRLLRTAAQPYPKGKTPMQVMDAITEILKREGISTMFCFPTTPIIEAAVAGGMRPGICRPERGGGHMAGGGPGGAHRQPAGGFSVQYGAGGGKALFRH